MATTDLVLTNRFENILPGRTMQIFISHEVSHKSHFKPLKIVDLHTSTNC